MAAGTPVVERPTLQDMIPSSIPCLIFLNFKCSNKATDATQSSLFITVGCKDSKK
jgi:hypothetical protein